MKASATKAGESAAEPITQRIAVLGDSRRETLSR